MQNACNRESRRRKDMGLVGRPLSSCAGSDQRTTCPLFIVANYYAPTQTLTDQRHRTAPDHAKTHDSNVYLRIREKTLIPILRLFYCAISNPHCHNVDLNFLRAFIIFHPQAFYFDRWTNNRIDAARASQLTRSLYSARLRTVT